jgi:hypothetical protein
MRSRRILWALLILAALPPALAATSGCGFEIGVAGTEPILENVLDCECSFGGAGSRQLRIQAASDDAEQNGASMNLARDTLRLGNRIVGVRFDGIAIPPGVSIQSGYVQFTADQSDGGAADFTIVGEASVSAATFTTTDNDLSGRSPVTASVPWSPLAWTSNDAGPAQQTADLSALLQELVNLPGWSTSSAVVLRFDGIGARTAKSFDGNSAEAPELIVTFDTTVTAVVPVCALPGADHDSVTGGLTSSAAAAECTRVEETWGGLNETCGYPEPVTCTVVDRLDPNGVDEDDSYQSDACNGTCDANEVDPNNPAATCSMYDPVSFAECRAMMMPLSTCKEFVKATNATGVGTPVCVASGSPLAFHAFGRRSLCEVEGLSEVRAGDREPKHDPKTAGTLELLGGPCPGGGCAVDPFFNLRMEPISFSVRWASDPTFRDLGAAGRGLEAAVVDGSGVASFAPDTIAGTATGRRGSNGIAINAMNSDPLHVGVDWAASPPTCSLDGALAVGVGDDGVCTGDGTTVCRVDSPDCDAVGGPCMLPADDSEEMRVAVALAGTLVNQPPAAEAGASQSIECTSTAGASFTLDGSGSSDPDQNLTLVSWREGNRSGPELSNGFTSVQSLGVGGAQIYVLRVIDAFAQSDEAETNVAVVDTTPPELAITVSPTTLWPPNHKFVPITVEVVTSDICDASPAIRLISITSNESANGSGDGNTSPDVQGALIGQDDRAFQLRAERSGNGSGRIYTILYEAMDDSGNATTRQATVTVPHQRR